MMEEKKTSNFIVNDQYRLERKIGSGSFGDIYLAKNIFTDEKLAVKIESNKTPNPQLSFENRLYNDYLKNGPGIPKIYHYGQEGMYNCLVMELLGPSLEDLFTFCGRKFSTKTTLLLGDQMLVRLEFVHSRYFIHRDVKPDNFLMGTGRYSNKVYIIDFGLSKKWKVKDAHIPYREDKALTGTPRYVSINAHLGLEQSRRDDLEAVGYVLLYFMRGILPWQGVKAATKRQKYDRICEKKLEKSVEELCDGLPDVFVRYLTYVRELDFEMRPDYAYLRYIFQKLYQVNGYRLDYMYDWITGNILKKNANPTGRTESHAIATAGNLSSRT
ncbi:hypothetical protein SNEBB_006838 [Seison nebaliae]|nr:hypothetical protein SNEBB_006838 [Seison nebaliae]